MISYRSGIFILIVKKERWILTVNRSFMILSRGMYFYEKSTILYASKGKHSKVTNSFQKLYQIVLYLDQLEIQYCQHATLLRLIISRYLDQLLPFKCTLSYTLHVSFYGNHRQVTYSSEFCWWPKRKTDLFSNGDTK